MKISKRILTAKRPKFPIYILPFKLKSATTFQNFISQIQIFKFFSTLTIFKFSLIFILLQENWESTCEKDPSCANTIALFYLWNLFGQRGDNRLSLTRQKVVRTNIGWNSTFFFTCLDQSESTNSLISWARAPSAVSGSASTWRLARRTHAKLLILICASKTTFFRISRTNWWFTHVSVTRASLSLKTFSSTRIMFISSSNSAMAAIWTKSFKMRTDLTKLTQNTSSTRL